MPEIRTSLTVDTNNRITNPGFSYDASGNLLYDGSHHYYYDAENHLIQVDGTLGTCSSATACYVYDAEGKRVQKTIGASQTSYLYDLSGRVVAENYGAAWAVGYVYAAGQLIAEYKNDTTFFVHPDHLGSTRLMTSMNQSIYDSMDYLPFGEQIAGDTGATHKFTGKERDVESNLDNFGARYDASSLGRFMSADPFIPFNLKKDKFQAWISNPQHWNKYAYALNNPLLYVDPSGMTETIYYWLNSSLTDAQKKYFQEHKTEILNAIADKLKQAGINDVVFKDGTTLSKSQVNSILAAQPKGVAFLNFANQSYAGVNAPSDMFGGTGGMRSAVFVGNLQAGNPSASDLSFRMSEVSDHELGHGMGFYSRGETMSFIEFWNKDLMNEGQGMPTKPRQFDMSIPQNRQAVDEINKLPEYNPPK